MRRPDHSSGQNLPVALVGGLLFLGSAPAGADLCLWVDSATAGRAAEIVGAATERLDLERARAAPIGTVEARREGGNSSRLFLDGVAVDLAHLFVRARGDEPWRNVGWLLTGCGDDNEPKRLAPQPFLPAAGEARRPPAPSRPAWHALAELPTVLKQWTDDDPEPRPVDVFEATEPRAARLATLVGQDDLPTREWDYERPAALVIEETEEWVRIRLHRGSGWVRRTDAGAIHPFVELVQDGLSYLDEAWDGRLFSAAGGGEVVRLDDGWRARVLGPEEIAAEVVESRAVDGALWLRVRVTTAVCAATDPTLVAEGWVPFVGRDGEPTVGFYSRGC